MEKCSSGSKLDILKFTVTHLLFNSMKLLFLSVSLPHFHVFVELLVMLHNSAENEMYSTSYRFGFRGNAINYSLKQLNLIFGLTIFIYFLDGKCRKLFILLFLQRACEYLLMRRIDQMIVENQGIQHIHGEFLMVLFNILVLS